MSKLYSYFINIHFNRNEYSELEKDFENNYGYQSEFILYKILHARAKILWKDNAHTFLMVSGMIIVFLSSLFFLNIWG